MSHLEKRSFVSIISTTLVYILYCLYVFQKYRSGDFNPMEDFRYWGSVILILIPVQIVVNIFIHIIFSIIKAIVTREEEEPDLTDERDNIIRLKANSISYVLVGAGFLISMITLVIGFPPFVMFNIVFFSFNAAEIIGSFIQLRFYRRGF